MLYRWNQNAIGYTQQVQNDDRFEVVHSQYSSSIDYIKAKSFTLNQSTGKYDLTHSAFYPQRFSGEDTPISTGIYSFSSSPSTNTVYDFYYSSGYVTVERWTNSTPGYYVEIRTSSTLGYGIRKYTVGKTAGTFNAYVYSLESDTYPTNGILDNYWYTIFIY